MKTQIDKHWRDNLDTREKDELRLAEYYATVLHHGTDGHIRLMLMNKLAMLLDEITDPETVA